MATIRQVVHGAAVANVGLRVRNDPTTQVSRKKAAFDVALPEDKLDKVLLHGFLADQILPQSLDGPKAMPSLPVDKILFIIPIIPILSMAKASFEIRCI